MKQKIYSGSTEFLNACRLAACFDPTERLFTPPEEDFRPSADIVMGSLKSVSVLLSLLEQSFEFCYKHSAYVLWSKLVLRFVDHDFRFISDKLLHGFPTKLIDNWSAWSFNTPASYYSCRSVLKYLQIINYSRSTATPN